MKKNIKIEAFAHNGNEIHYRWVWIDELGEEVRVGIDEEYCTYIEEGSYCDDMFACYIPKDVFNEYSDNELKYYVETNFYDYND